MNTELGNFQGYKCAFISVAQSGGTFVISFKPLFFCTLPGSGSGNPEAQGQPVAAFFFFTLYIVITAWVIMVRLLDGPRPVSVDFA